jgi:hypothetical protein
MSCASAWTSSCSAVVVPVGNFLPGSALVKRAAYRHPCEVNDVRIRSRKIENAPVVFRRGVVGIGQSPVFGQQKAFSVGEVDSQPIGHERANGQAEVIVGGYEVRDLRPGFAAIGTFYHLTGFPIIMVCGINRGIIAWAEFDVCILAVCAK